MHPTSFALALGGILVTAPMAAGDLIFDQIGDEPFVPQAASSSQFQPGMPEDAITTVDNFSIISTDGGAVRLTRIEATVLGLNNFVGFEFVDSWTVQIYSSLEASYASLTGDVFSASFAMPDALTTGFASFGGRPVELASFDVDTIIGPGDYFMTVAMENDSGTNGIMAIAHGTIGDGGAWFSGPGLGEAVQLPRPAGYRILGEAIPAPGCAVLLVGLVARRRRARSRAGD